MEFIDDQTLLFDTLSHYQSAFDAKIFIQDLLKSKQLSELIKEDSIYGL